MKFDISSRKSRFLLWGYILLATFLLRSVFFFQHINSPLSLHTPVTIEVSSGTTFNSLVTRLADQDIITSPLDVRFYGRMTGLADDIRAGDYRLQPGMNARDLLMKLVAGDTILYQLVIVEGWNLQQALAAIQANEFIETTFDRTDKATLQALFNTDFYPEGLLFPDTYHFERGTSDREILSRASTLMTRVLEEEWSSRDVGLPYDTSYEALVMASIVEKETGLASERQQIAGVFVRRLQQRMRLQTDPTVIYGLGESFDGDLTRADLRAPSPYNTYLINGLPPTPIALPGRAAIHAAMHPDDSDTLYFVARGDGGHYFSSTLEEHQAAVDQYQLGN